MCSCSDAYERLHNLTIEEKKQKIKIMTIFEKLKEIERVHLLIQRKATGNPGALAQKLGYSERHVKRIIAEMRNLGLSIGYDRDRCTYYYEKPVSLNFDILKLSPNDEKSIKGGKFLYNYLPMTKNVPDQDYL